MRPPPRRFLTPALVLAAWASGLPAPALPTLVNASRQDWALTLAEAKDGPGPHPPVAVIVTDERTGRSWRLARGKGKGQPRVILPAGGRFFLSHHPLGKPGIKETLALVDAQGQTGSLSIFYAFSVQCPFVLRTHGLDPQEAEKLFASGIILKPWDTITIFQDSFRKVRTGPAPATDLSPITEGAETTPSQAGGGETAAAPSFSLPPVAPRRESKAPAKQ